MRIIVAGLATIVSIACSRGDGGATPDATRGDSAGANAPPALADSVFPLVGVAVRDTTGGWCAMFPVDFTREPRSGEALAVVFASEGAIAWYGRIVGKANVQCHTEVAQPRWADYRAYHVSITDSSTTATTSGVGLAVVSPALWSRSVDGRTIADLDGDGRSEDLRRCTADEGEHFTIWSTSDEGGRLRRAHEYFDWGVNTEPRCTPAEAGHDIASRAP